MNAVCAMNTVASSRGLVKTSAARVNAAATSGSTSGKSVIQSGKKFANLKEAVDAGLLKGCAPFPDGIDAFGFYNGISTSDAQRYADVEITHGRVAMLASLGFLVGEQVEGSGFLFDAQVTGPAINHFQQVPTPFWLVLGAVIFISESQRVQFAWQNPFEADKLFLLKTTHVPGDYAFDPLNLGEFKTAEEMTTLKMKELNNGRLAMVSITAMVVQELVTGLNLLLSDEVDFIDFAKDGGGGKAVAAMEAACRGSPDENACAKAFEAAVAAGTVSF